jgi:xanthine dehydrogenase YagS FAD-binding subunit
MERDTWDFALASAAVSLRRNGGTIEQARVVLGGVAPIPWRSREAEAALVGKALDAATAAAAAEEALRPARPLRDNAFKVDLTKAVLRDTLLRLA